MFRSGFPYRHDVPGGDWLPDFPPRPLRIRTTVYDVYDPYLEDFPHPRYSGRAMTEMLTDPYRRTVGRGMPARPLRHHAPRAPRYLMPDLTASSFRARMRRPESMLVSERPRYKAPPVQKKVVKPEPAIMAQIKQEKNEGSRNSEPQLKAECNNESKSAEVEPAQPSGPRISAKQMWESSYLETISENAGSESIPPLMPPSEVPVISTSTRATPVSKHKKKSKFRRGPYFKKKGKKSNGKNESQCNEFPRMCEACNVQLTGEEQAKSHDASDMHKENMAKILEKNRANAKIPLDKLNETLPLPTNTPECLTWGIDTGDRTVNTVRFCRLCSVSMTSLTNAKQHYAGKSHAKKIRIVQRGHYHTRKPTKPTQFVSGGVLGLQASAIKPAYSYTAVPVQQRLQQTIQPQIGVVQSVTDIDSAPGTTSINLKPALPSDFANSMTPSGQYYCQTCNTVIEKAGSLNAHIQSKAHKQAKARV